MKIAFLWHGLQVGGILTVKGGQQAVEMAELLRPYADDKTVAYADNTHNCRESMNIICKTLGNLPGSTEHRLSSWLRPEDTYAVLKDKHSDASLVIIVTHNADIRASVTFFRDAFGLKHPETPYVQNMEGYLIDTDEKTIVHIARAAH
jgi:hypothetical protein